MNAQFVSASVVIVSIAVYQTNMKLVSGALNPLHVLVTIFSTALLCTLLAIKFVPALQTTTTEPFLSNFPYSAVIVGLAIVGVELGYLLMFRSGCHLASAPLVTMGGAAVLLTIIGAILFSQPLTARTIAGLVIVISGLYILSIKPGET